MDPQNVAPSVVFAQKASAVVRAAGFDPQSLDIEMFRKYAPDIFYSAVQGIYKEQLSANLDDQGQDMSEDQIVTLKCQLFINKLATKTGNPMLATISASEVAEGNHRAIGILVSIIFAEGQKLWLEKKARLQGKGTKSSEDFAVEGDADSKLKPVVPVAPESATATGTILNDINETIISGARIRPSSAPSGRTRSPSGKQKRTKDSSQLQSTTPAPADTAPKGRPSSASGSRQIKPSVPTQAYFASAAFTASPASTANTATPASHSPTKANMKLLVMEGLVDRIKVLESQIDDINKEDRDTTALLREFDEFVRGKRSQTNDASALNALTKPVTSLLSPRARAFTITPQQPQSNGNPTDSEDPTNQRKAKRPSSAPSKRAKAREQNAFFQRLYSEAQEQRQRMMDQQLQLQQLELESRKQNQPQPARRQTDDGEEYVYDINGRRVPQHVAEQAEEARQRAKQMQGQVHFDLRDIRHNLNLPIDADTKPKGKDPQGHIILSQRFEESMHNYVKRTRDEREQAHHPQKPIPTEYTTAKCFNEYKYLEPLDLILSVEHCHECEKHASTTRHDPDDYINMAHQTLRSLAEVVHNHCLCVRLGVVRIKAKIDSHSHSQVHIHDGDSRIGALEVQIGFRNRHGQVLFDLLHSKLATSRWPSKCVVEKRLLAFVTKAKIPAFSPPLDGAGEWAGYVSCSDGRESADSPVAYAVSDADRLQEYPIGVGPWAGTPLAAAGWYLPIINKKHVAPQEPAPNATQSQKSAKQQSAKSQTPAQEKEKVQTQTTPRTKQGALSTTSQPTEQSPAQPQHQSPLPTLCVQWVYDSRGSVVALPIPVGTAVCVHNVEGYYGNDDAHAVKEVNYMLGVVKGPAHKPGSANNSNQSGNVTEFVVRLKYFKVDHVVSVADCVKVSDMESSSNIATDSSGDPALTGSVSCLPLNNGPCAYDLNVVPLELQALILLWQEMETVQKQKFEQAQRIKQQQQLQAEQLAQVDAPPASTATTKTATAGEPAIEIAITRPVPVWRAMESVDVVEDADGSHARKVHVCRATLFHQLRHVAAWINYQLQLGVATESRSSRTSGSPSKQDAKAGIVRNLFGIGDQTSSDQSNQDQSNPRLQQPPFANSFVVHPLTGDRVCLQNCYTEQMLAWIESRCTVGQSDIRHSSSSALVDCIALMNLVLGSIRAVSVCERVLRQTIRHCNKSEPVFSSSVTLYTASEHAPPSYRKPTKLDQVTTALNETVFLLRNRIGVACVQMCKLRRINIFNGSSSSNLSSMIITEPVDDFNHGVSVDLTATTQALDDCLHLLLELVGCTCARMETPLPPSNGAESTNAANSSAVNVKFQGSLNCAQFRQLLKLLDIGHQSNIAFITPAPSDLFSNGDAPENVDLVARKLWRGLSPSLCNTISVQSFREYLVDPVLTTTTTIASDNKQPQSVTKLPSDGSFGPATSSPVGPGSVTIISPYNYWTATFGSPDLSIVWQKFTFHFKATDGTVSGSSQMYSKSLKLSNSKSLETLQINNNVSSTPTADALSLAPTRSPRSSQIMPQGQGQTLGDAGAAATGATQLSPRGSQLFAQSRNSIALSPRGSQLLRPLSPRASTVASVNAGVGVQTLPANEEPVNPYSFDVPSYTHAPISSELLSFCKTMLLKADILMNDTDYLKLCDSFKLEHTHTLPELHLLIRVFWTAASANNAVAAATSARSTNAISSAATTPGNTSSAGPASSTKGRASMRTPVGKLLRQNTFSGGASGSNSTSSNANAAPTIDLEALFSGRQLRKFDFLLWLLDLHPVCVCVNLLAMVCIEFGNNRDLALRAFTEILLHTFQKSNAYRPADTSTRTLNEPATGWFNESEFLKFLLDKLNIKIEAMSLFAIALRTLFMKSGKQMVVLSAESGSSPTPVPKEVVMCVQVRVLTDYLHACAELGVEDTSLLSAQYHEKALAAAANAGSGQGSNSERSSVASRTGSNSNSNPHSTVASRLNSADTNSNTINNAISNSSGNINPSQSSNPPYGAFSRQVSGASATQSLLTVSEEGDFGGTGVRTMPQYAAAVDQLLQNNSEDQQPSKPATASPTPRTGSKPSTDVTKPGSTSARSDAIQSNLGQGKSSASVVVASSSSVKFPAWKTLPTALPGEPPRGVENEIEDSAIDAVSSLSPVPVPRSPRSPLVPLPAFSIKQSLRDAVSPPSEPTSQNVSEQLDSLLQPQYKLKSNLPHTLSAEYLAIVDVREKEDHAQANSASVAGASNESDCADQGVNCKIVVVGDKGNTTAPTSAQVESAQHQETQADKDFDVLLDQMLEGDTE